MIDADQQWEAHQRTRIHRRLVKKAGGSVDRNCNQQGAESRRGTDVNDTEDTLLIL